MNGILSLGHFCESHGPCVILCTQSISELYLEQPPHSLTVPWCDACKSINVNEAYVSHREGNATYITTRTALKQDMAFLLKQACIRSLSCEEETGKEGGTLYFGDYDRGHVLSYTFRLPDSLARGFQRLFTLILLMRDKVHLLNSWPFVTAQFKNVANFLKEKASNVNMIEQNKCPQRVQRLATGTPGSPRSLVQLTETPEVFGQIHLWFTWILIASSKELSENIDSTINVTSNCLENKINTEYSVVQMNNKTAPCNTDSTTNLRVAYKYLGADIFRAACYCILIGQQVVLRGPKEINAAILNSLSIIIPVTWRKIIPHANEYLKPEMCNFLGLSLHIAVPQSNDSIMRIDIVNDKCHLKWTGSVPNKLPTVLTRIMKTVENEKLKDEVVDIQITVIVQEWFNNIQSIAWTREGFAPEKIMSFLQVLGIQSYDVMVVQYWLIQINLHRNTS